MSQQCLQIDYVPNNPVTTILFELLGLILILNVLFYAPHYHTLHYTNYRIFYMFYWQHLVMVRWKEKVIVFGPLGQFKHTFIFETDYSNIYANLLIVLTPPSFGCFPCYSYHVCLKPSFYHNKSSQPILSWI